MAERRGRKLPFMVGLFALPLRGLLFAFFDDPAWVLAVQVLDGLTVATVFVLTPVIIADVAAGSGRFNVVQGVVGMAAGIGSIVGPPRNAKLHPTVAVNAMMAHPDAKTYVHYAEAVRDGKLKLPIERIMPMQQAAEAHAMAEKGGVGKIVLTA